jgi:hypothetical protein
MLWRGWKLRNLLDVGGDLKRLAGFWILFATLSANAAEPIVPPEFIGDWVPLKASCQSKTLLRVAPAAVTLLSGANSQQFGDIGICYSCEGGAQYSGEVVWLTPEFHSGSVAPFIVRFNANEEKGVAVVEIKSGNIKRRFPVHERKLRKCP